jgi:hypothetical protein
MNATSLIGSLDRFAGMLPVVLYDVSDADARWKPPDNAWSILEVVAHLADEEADDFRGRLRLTFESPQADWPPIDPEGWALQRRYNEGDLAEQLQRFDAERRQSLDWLRSLVNPDWSIAHITPRHGPIHAGDLLASWAAHDMLHLRQIAKRLFQLTQRDGEPYGTIYAGQWTAWPPGHS